MQKEWRTWRDKYDSCAGMGRGKNTKEWKQHNLKSSWEQSWQLTKQAHRKKLTNQTQNAKMKHDKQVMAKTIQKKNTSN
jgi:allophanate hydrolase subunit 2